MRAMIVGGVDPRNLHHDYAPLSEDENETEDEHEHEEEDNYEEEEEDNYENNYEDNYEEEEDEEEEDEEEEEEEDNQKMEYHQTTHSSDGLLMQWRSENIHETTFVKESHVPFHTNNSNVHGNTIDFGDVATVAAQLFELWNALGVSYQARRKTLRGLHATARGSDTNALMSTMLQMKKKLETMLNMVRREMAAVRRCDALLNRASDGKRSDEQLQKLVSVLQRVLPKWEQTHQKPFLFRGLRYLDLMEVLLRQRCR